MRCARAFDEVFVSSLAPVELLLPYASGARLAELHELAGELRARWHTTRRGPGPRACCPVASAARFARFAYRRGTT